MTDQGPKNRRMLWVILISVVGIVLFTLYLMNFRFKVAAQKIQTAIFGDPNKIVVKDCFDAIEWQKVPFAVKKKQPPAPKIVEVVRPGMPGVDPFMPVERIPKTNTTVQLNFQKELTDNSTTIHVEAFIKDMPANLKRITAGATLRRKNIVCGGDNMREIFCEQLQSGDGKAASSYFFRGTFTTEEVIDPKKSRDYVIHLECIFEMDQAVYGPQHIFRENFELPLIPK